MTFPTLSVLPCEITQVARRRFRRYPQQGLIYLALLSALTARAAPAGSGADNHPPVKMEKFVVNDRHLLCFGLGLELWEDKNTHRVLAMYVKAVQPESMADQEGITPGSRIFGINGLAVDNFSATFGEGSELNQLFINRKNGDRVTLELKLMNKRGTRFITLVQHSGLNVNISQNHPKAD